MYLLCFTNSDYCQWLEYKVATSKDDSNRRPGLRLVRRILQKHKVTSQILW